jgi:hypothetical protein
MFYLGDFLEDETIYVFWNTNDGSGASITRAVDGSIRIYKDGGVAEKTTANGITDSEDFDALTGVHLVTIDTSDDTGDAGFWVTGSDYVVVLQGSTIDGQVVNHAIAAFSIENRFQEVDVTSLGGSAQSATDLKDFADAGYDPATNKVQGVALVDTTTANSDMRGTDNAALASVLGALADVAADGDPTAIDTVMQYVKQLINILIGTDGIVAFPAEAAPANNVSLAEVIRAIHTDVTGVGGITPSVPGDAMALTAGGVDDIWDEAKAGHVGVGSFGEEVQAHSLSAEIAALNDVSTAEVNTEVDTALSDARLDELISATAGGVDPVAGSISDQMMNKDGGQTFNQATDSLEGIRDTAPLGTVMRGTDNALLAASAPANWSAMGIEADGHVHGDLKEWLGVAMNVLVAGRVDADVGNMQNNVITAAAIAAAAITAAEAPNLDAAVSSRAVAGDAMALTAAAVDAILDDVVEGGLTMRHILRISLAALAGISTGGGGANLAFRDNADGKDRIAAVVDANGNRTAVVLDGV